MRERGCEAGLLQAKTGSLREWMRVPLQLCCAIAWAGISFLMTEQMERLSFEGATGM